MKYSKPWLVLKHCLKSVFLSKSRFALSVLGIAVSTLLVSICILYLDAYSDLEINMYSEYSDRVMVASRVVSLPEECKKPGYRVYAYKGSGSFMYRQVSHETYSTDFLVYVYEAPTNALDYYMPTFERFDTIFKPEILYGRAFLPEDGEGTSCIMGEFESLVLFGKPNGVGETLLVPIEEEVKLPSGNIEVAVTGYRSLTVVGILRNDLFGEKEQLRVAKSLETDRHDMFYLYVFSATSTATPEGSDVAIFYCGETAPDDHGDWAYNISTLASILGRLSYAMSQINRMAQIAFLFLMFIFGINLMNVMFFAVKERVVEIAVKKTLGATSQDIMIEFLLQGCIVGAVGSLIGEALALTVTVVGAMALKASIYPQLTLRISPQKLLALITISMAFSVLFTLIPALIASKTRISKALRFD